MSTNNFVLELPVYFTNRVEFYSKYNPSKNLVTLIDFLDCLERDNPDAFFANSAENSRSNAINWFVRYKSNKLIPFPKPKAVLVLNSTGSLLFDHQELLEWYNKFATKKVVKAQTRLEQLTKEMESLKKLMEESESISFTGKKKKSNSEIIIPK